MASLALHFRPICKIPTNPSSLIHPNPRHAVVHHFSSSSSTDNSGDPPPDKPPSQSSSFASYFSDVKASLKQQQQQQQKQQNRQQYFTRKPLPFTSPKPQSKVASLEEIRKNLSEFRSLSTPPPPSGPANSTASPPPASSQSVSFQELYHRNGAGWESDKTSPAKKGERPWFEEFRERFRRLKETPPSNGPERRGNRVTGHMSLPDFKSSHKIRPPDPDRDSTTTVIGGSDSVPFSIFRNGFKENKEDSTTTSTKFVKIYTFEDLGRKLRKLRPEAKGKNWFSLGELNERLVKLREMELKEAETNFPGPSFRELRNCLYNIQETEDSKAKRSTIQRLEVLSQIGGTPAFMLAPPKEHLVEKYFHPDNMSSAEKLKLELQKVRDEFKMFESDCGSSRVQVAQLTTKIKHLSTVLHKKDKHSRKGLQEMVQKRKKLLKYLRRTDWDSYCLVLSKLGLRDSPESRS